MGKFKNARVFTSSIRASKITLMGGGKLNLEVNFG
jgi:hypothetical protein